jgi:hypothetical protein
MISCAYYILSWIQFYYLIYNKKIFPKKIIGKKNVWNELIDELDGKIKWKNSENK